MAIWQIKYRTEKWSERIIDSERIEVCDSAMIEEDIKAVNCTHGIYHSHRIVLRENPGLYFHGDDFCSFCHKRRSRRYNYD